MEVCEPGRTAELVSRRLSIHLFYPFRNHLEVIIRNTCIVTPNISRQGRWGKANKGCPAAYERPLLFSSLQHHCTILHYTITMPTGSRVALRRSRPLGCPEVYKAYKEKDFRSDLGISIAKTLLCLQSAYFCYCRATLEQYDTEQVSPAPQ